MFFPPYTEQSLMMETAAGGAKTEAKNPVVVSTVNATVLLSNPEYVACPGSVAFLSNSGFSIIFS